MKMITTAQCSTKEIVNDDPQRTKMAKKEEENEPEEGK
jgi:hypothetical protein